jgi:hypothetical protein
MDEELKAAEAELKKAKSEHNKVATKVRHLEAMVENIVED